MLHYLLIAFYAAISGFGLYRIKQSEAVVSFSFIQGCVLYGIGFLLWLYMLRVLPLSIAFPAAAGSLIVATQIIGVLFLGEAPDSLRLGGVTLILLGTIIVYARQ